ncbi:unnamed protein product [Amoebophrya sp. A120]|nr:unnamed protein product [Amoebophrya sp. A120]|eukprot:GSA120T00022964001.1
MHQLRRHQSSFVVAQTPNAAGAAPTGSTFASSCRGRTDSGDRDAIASEENPVCTSDCFFRIVHNEQVLLQHGQEVTTTGPLVQEDSLTGSRATGYNFHDDPQGEERNYVKGVHEKAEYLVQMNCCSTELQPRGDPFTEATAPQREANSTGCVTTSTSLVIDGDRERQRQELLNYNQNKDIIDPPLRLCKTNSTPLYDNYPATQEVLQQEAGATSRANKMRTHSDYCNARGTPPLTAEQRGSSRFDTVVMRGSSSSSSASPLPQPAGVAEPAGGPGWQLGQMSPLAEQLSRSYTSRSPSAMLGSLSRNSSWIWNNATPQSTGSSRGEEDDAEFDMRVTIEGVSQVLHLSSTTGINNAMNPTGTITASSTGGAGAAAACWGGDSIFIGEGSCRMSPKLQEDEERDGELRIPGIGETGPHGVRGSVTSVVSRDAVISHASLFAGHISGACVATVDDDGPPTRDALLLFPELDGSHEAGQERSRKASNGTSRSRDTLVVQSLGATSEVEVTSAGLDGQGYNDEPPTLRTGRASRLQRERSAPNCNNIRGEQEAPAQVFGRESDLAVERRKASTSSLLRDVSQKVRGRGDSCVSLAQLSGPTRERAASSSTCFRNIANSRCRRIFLAPTTQNVNELAAAELYNNLDFSATSGVNARVSTGLASLAVDQQGEHVSLDFDGSLAWREEIMQKAKPTTPAPQDQFCSSSAPLHPLAGTCSKGGSSSSSSRAPSLGGGLEDLGHVRTARKASATSHQVEDERKQSDHSSYPRSSLQPDTIAVEARSRAPTTTRVEFHNGDVYTGEVVNEQRHGVGEYEYGPEEKQRKKYEGEWRQNLKAGQGILYWHNGDCYVGNWQQNKRHGCGVFLSSCGSGPQSLPAYKYEGQWAADAQNGLGMEETHFGTYFGNFVQGRRQGLGVERVLYSTGRDEQQGGGENNPGGPRPPTELLNNSASTRNNAPADKPPPPQGPPSSPTGFYLVEDGVRTPCALNSLTDLFRYLGFDLDHVREYLDIEHDQALPPYYLLETLRIPSSCSTALQRYLFKRVVRMMAEYQRAVSHSLTMQRAISGEGAAYQPKVPPGIKRIRQDEIEKLDFISKGGFGAVYKGLWRRKAATSPYCPPTALVLPDKCVVEVDHDENKIGGQARRTSPGTSTVEINRTAAGGSSTSSVSVPPNGSRAGLRTESSRNHKSTAGESRSDSRQQFSSPKTEQKVDCGSGAIRFDGAATSSSSSETVACATCSSGIIERFLTKLSDLRAGVMSKAGGDEKQHHDAEMIGQRPGSVVQSVTTTRPVALKQIMSLVPAAAGRAREHYRQQNSKARGAGELSWSKVEEVRVRKEFLKEVTVLQAVRHPNVVEFLGVCHLADNSGEDFLVVEYCPFTLFNAIHRAAGGTNSYSFALNQVDCSSCWDPILDRYLRAPRHHHARGKDGAGMKNVSEETMTRKKAVKTSSEKHFYTNDLRANKRRIFGVGQDVAEACVYLHSQGIIHADLKSPNVLLTQEFTAKVCDFGHAAIRNNPRAHHKLGTPHWAAPEALRGECIGFPSDVWSVGVIFWEMLHRSVPFRGHSFGSVIAAVGWGRVGPVYDTGGPGRNPSERICLDLQTKILLDACLQVEAADRASIDELAAMFSAVLDGGESEEASPVAEAAAQ